MHEYIVVNLANVLAVTNTSILPLLSYCHVDIESAEKSVSVS